MSVKTSRGLVSVAELHHQITEQDSAAAVTRALSTAARSPDEGVALQGNMQDGSLTLTK